MKELVFIRKFRKEFGDDITNAILEKYSICSKSSLKRKFEALTDIINNNNTQGNTDSSLDCFQQYEKETNHYRKYEIRHGKEKTEKHRVLLQQRKRPTKIVSSFNKNYWIDKGFSEEEAKLKISQLCSKAALSRKPESYKNHSKKIKYSLDYWTNQGYSFEEAIILRQQYLKPMLNDYNSMIERYGEEEGRFRYNNRIEKYKKSCKENRHTYKSAGCVSRESLKFFIPLYKKIRKLGLQRSDIYFGIDGSREFFIRKEQHQNEGRFFDFVIPKLGVVIEFNGIFWHPKPNNKSIWKNPWISYEDAMIIEKEKQKLVESRKFKLFVVWSDSIDLEKECDVILEYIKGKMQ